MIKAEKQNLIKVVTMPISGSLGDFYFYGNTLQHARRYGNFNRSTVHTACRKCVSIEMGTVTRRSRVRIHAAGNCGFSTVDFSPEINFFLHLHTERMLHIFEVYKQKIGPLLDFFSKADWFFDLSSSQSFSTKKKKKITIQKQNSTTKE